MDRHLRSTSPTTPIAGPEASAVGVAPPGSRTAAFADAARVLSLEARRRGLAAPGFRSPPRLLGVDRTLRRHPSGASVAVRVRDRPWVAVAADMIEGVIAVNELRPPQSDRLRGELWGALGFVAHSAPVPAAPDRRVA